MFEIITDVETKQAKTDVEAYAHAIQAEKAGHANVLIRTNGEDFTPTEFYRAVLSRTLDTSQRAKSIVGQVTRDD